jgi:hypothetical protein
MRTAYDVLRRAVIKDFGWWYRTQWGCITEEVKDRIKSGAAFQHFGNPFLKNLNRLYVGEAVIRGTIGWGCSFEEESEYEVNIEKLKVKFIYHWFVYSSFDFDYWFELRGFRSKKEAIDFYKKQKKREDDHFYTFMFKW